MLMLTGAVYIKFECKRQTIMSVKAQKILNIRDRIYCIKINLDMNTADLN